MWAGFAVHTTKEGKVVVYGCIGAPAAAWHLPLKVCAAGRGQCEHGASALTFQLSSRRSHLQGRAGAWHWVLCPNWPQHHPVLPLRSPHSCLHTPLLLCMCRRAVLVDDIECSVPTSHSIILCFLFDPDALPSPHIPLPVPFFLPPTVHLCRAVLVDGIECSVPTGHSIILCFLFGPLGLLSHFITRAIHTVMAGTRQPASSLL